MRQTMNDGKEKTRTIALFGATGKTGREFLKLSLGKGYSVRVLVRDIKKLEDVIGKNPAEVAELFVVQGSLEETDKLREVVSGATHVVCMVAIPGNDSSYQHGFMENFIKSLHSILRETKPKLLLYQAGAMSADGRGHMHPLSFLAKHTVGRKLSILSKIADNNSAIRYIQEQHDESACYDFIVTRAGVLVDGPHTKKVVWSLYWPPLPYLHSITFADLAEFTLDALDDETLRNTCPYVR